MRITKQKRYHLLCFDLESWIFSHRFNERKLSLSELRDLDNGYTLQVVEYTLKILKRYNQKITFFVVTKLEQIYPGLIKKLLIAGHEVAWHTHTHTLVDTIKKLEGEIHSAKRILHKYKIRGFQAPNLTFIREGYRILKKHGFLYSSSIYGNSDYVYKFDNIFEIPVSTTRSSYHPLKEEIHYPSNMSFRNMLRFGIPYGSSYFWSIFRKGFYEKKLQEAEKRSGLCNLFIHDWQLITPPSPEYKKDVNFWDNPLFVPYRINSAKMFESLMANFRFKRYIDYLSDKKLLRKVNEL